MGLTMPSRLRRLSSNHDYWLREELLERRRIAANVAGT